ncbi:hypothetical protein FOZ63_007563 [Perkinsus olseni]|uniref:Uncharacterized protein n=1 Tax=Perkinsus olseni TaxID=32597 RepID=A0A7J6QWC8_PEROL|nr:hypothetical protein FOZ63_007563 [Perkinsus olseni]KAF4753971.1 hypothetical protein FOZ62_002562 [Perkinsus olseni]
MRSTAALSSATAAVLGALMFQNAAASKLDYACHIPDNSTVPISCIVSKSRGLFDLGEPKWLPSIYSEHTVETDEDGLERYVSSSCIVHPGLKDGKPYMGADNTCGIDWLRDAGGVEYISGPNGYLVDMPLEGGETYKQQHFRKLEMEPISRVPLNRVGRKHDLVGRFANDEPAQWRAEFYLESSSSSSSPPSSASDVVKRRVFPIFEVTDPRRHSRGRTLEPEHMLSSFSDRKMAVGESIPERFWDLWGKPPGEAFFFKFGSSAWPGEYALFLKFNEEAFILFNETDRVRRRASANLASTSGGAASGETSIWEDYNKPPPSYEELFDKERH